MRIVWLTVVLRFVLLDDVVRDMLAKEDDAPRRDSSSSSSSSHDARKMVVVIRRFDRDLEEGEHDDSETDGVVL